MPYFRLAAVPAVCALTLAASPAKVAYSQELGAFRATLSLETGDSPGEALIADFNGDGRPDLAVPAAGANALEVFLRQAQGSFQRATYGAGQLVPTQPNFLAAADVDGDSDLDLAVSSSSGSGSAILLNDGAGAFTYRQTLSGSGDVAFGDFDNDGDSDLAISLAGSPTLVVYANSLGDFALDSERAGGHGHLAIADLDGDGALDVAVSDQAAGDVSVFWNDAGALLPAVRIPSQAAPAGIVVGDVNGDGRADLVTSGAEPAYELGVLSNLGGRAFAPVAITPTGTPASVVALGDVDGDGDLDLAVTGRREPSDPVRETVSTWINAGNGTFSWFETVGAGEGPASATFGDVDGDGDADLAVAFAATGSVRLYASSDGRLQAPPDVPLGGSGPAGGLAHGDVDGDGRGDLIVAQGGTVQIFGMAGSSPTSVPVGESLRGVAAGDIDGDGDVDLVVVDEAMDQLGVLFNDGGGTLDPPVWSSSCATPQALVLADVNRDGDLDALIPCGPLRTVRVRMNDGRGGFLTQGGEALYAFGSSPVAVAAGDADGDGYLDLAVAVGGTNIVGVHRMYSPYTSPYYTPMWSATGCQAPGSIAFEDLNGDARPDIAVTCVAESRVRIYLGASNGTYVEGAPLAIAEPRAVALADADCDGDRDLVALRGGDDAVVVLLNDGAAHFTATDGYGTGAGATLLSVGDLDGDGDADVATAGGPRPALTTLTNTRDGCSAGFTLSVDVASVVGGAGSVTVLPGGAICSNDPGTTGQCEIAFASGAQVTLIPNPSANSAFIGWDGACSNNQGCVVTLSQARTVRALFRGPQTITLSLSSVHDGYGALSVSPAALGGEESCVLPPGAPSASCALSYVHGAVVTITAAPGPGALATIGGCSNPCSVLAYAKTVTASFGIPTQPPVAHAGGPYTGFRNAPIVLDGTASSDPDGEPLTYQWTFSDTTGTATSATPTRYYGTLGTFTAALVVNDGMTPSAPATATVTVTNAPPSVTLLLSNGQMFPAGSPVSMGVALSDDVAVTRVIYYRGSTVILASSTSPFTIYPVLPAGRHVITARAFDADGASTTSLPVTIDVATARPATADAYVRELNGSNFGLGPALEVRRAPVNSGHNRWTYLLFHIGGLPSVQGARLRLFGNVSETTSTPIAVQAFSAATPMPWSETSLNWGNKPTPGSTVLASAPLVINSTGARWYEWDVTQFVLAERAAGRNYITIVLKNDVETAALATFRSRQATSNQPELRITP